jgi:hypothetical protein
MSELGLFRRFGGLLAGTPWFQRSVYQAFHALYHHRNRRYLIQLALVYGVNLLTDLIVAEHRIPKGSNAEFLLSWLLPGFLVLGSVVSVEVPIGVVARYEERGKLRDNAVATGLYDVLADAIHIAKKLTPAEAVECLFGALLRGNGAVYFLTPNAIYILADRFLERYRSEQDPEVGMVLEELAKSAPHLRGCLQSVQGPLHWIMPDPENEEVRIFLKLRARKLGISERPVTGANREGARWVQELSRSRAKSKRATKLHAISCVPGHRVLLTEELCMFQEFPQRVPALGQPTFVISATDAPEVFAGIRLAFAAWAEILPAASRA